MCLNGKRWWCSVINVFNVTDDENSNFVQLEVYPFFYNFFISKLGMQPKTNLITFDLKCNFCKKLTVILSKATISSSWNSCLLEVSALPSSSFGWLNSVCILSQLWSDLVYSQPISNWPWRHPFRRLHSVYFRDNLTVSLPIFWLTWINTVTLQFLKIYIWR